MKIALTGGHFSPALAVIGALPKETDILVLGRKYAFEGEKSLSYEYQICQEHSIPFKNIPAVRFHRKVTRYTLPSFMKVPIGFSAAFGSLRHFKPDVLLTFGGYVAFPVAIAAALLNIPIIVHEQTQDAGLTNKLIGKFAEKVCISFESSRKYFSASKTVLTGNPIRPELYSVHKKISVPQDLKVIYITGGSTGSHAINSLVRELLPSLLENFCIIHQTGDSQEYRDFEELENIQNTLGEKLKKRYIVKKFVIPDEIGFIMKRADLIISRSGINTVLEVLAMKKPFIFIPLPYGQKDEQLKNARLAQSTGLGVYLEQKNATTTRLHELILEIMERSAKPTLDTPYIIRGAANNIVNSIQLVHAQRSRKKK